jgi:predicted nucleic acid-binding protein
MRAVDTNVLVRLVVGDETRQAQAAEVFVGQGAWVSHLALAEMTWVLESVHELEAAQLATAIEMLVKNQALTVQDGALDAGDADASDEGGEPGTRARKARCAGARRPRRLPCEAGPPPLQCRSTCRR